MIKANLMQPFGSYSAANDQTVNLFDQSSLESADPFSWTNTPLVSGEDMNKLEGSKGSCCQPRQTSSGSVSANQQRNPSESYAKKPSQAAGKTQKKANKKTQDFSALDSSDYWLRFDSDEDGADLPGYFDQVMQPSSRRSTNTDIFQFGTGRSMSFGCMTPDEFVQTTSPENLSDSALDNALTDEDEGISLSLTDQMSKIDTSAPTEIPPREGLYSTPLSWEKPHLGSNAEQQPTINIPTTITDRQRLLALTIPPVNTLMDLDLGFEPESTTTTMSKISFPESQQTTVTRKANVPSRASTHSAASPREGKPKATDRTAHNNIERKYRTNLKDRISELREAIPSLRALPDADDEEGSSPKGSSRAPKVSKGTVLTKATEYIRYLERRNKAVMQQHDELSRRLQAFEELLTAAAQPGFQVGGQNRTLYEPRAFN